MDLIVKTAISDDYRNALTIQLGDKKLYFFDGEPEDANLSRDFNACYSIDDLIVKAFEAGTNGDTLNCTSEEVTWENI